MPHVFISYVHENWDTVLCLRDALKAYDIDVWLDRERISPGARWTEAIRDAINEGAFFIACFSEEYIRKTRTYMNEEIIIAIEELRLRPFDRVWFIPVLLSKCDIPKRSIGAGETLASLQWLDLSENWSQGIHRILSVIQPVSGKVHELVQALNDDSIELRIKAAEDLGKIGLTAKNAVPELLDALEDEDETLRAAIIGALTKIGVSSSEIVSRVVLSIDKKADSSVHYLHSVTLVRMGKDAVSSIIQELNKPHKREHRIWDVLYHTLVLIGAPVVPILLQTLNSADKDLKWMLLMVLHGLKKLAKPAIGIVLQELNGEDDRCKNMAIQVLGEIGDPVAIPAILLQLNDSSGFHSESHGRKAAEALGEIGDPIAVPALIQTLKDESKEALHRGACAYALGKIGDPVAVPTLIEIFENENNDSDLRIKTAQALGNLGEGAKVAVAILSEALQAREPKVRFFAALAIWEIEKNAKLVIPALIQTLQYQRLSLQRWAASILGEIGPEAIDAVPELRIAIEKAIPDERNSFISALKKIDPKIDHTLL